MRFARLLLVCGLLSSPALAQFSDVPEGHWAAGAMQALAALGILQGFPDGTFRGDQPLTRYGAALLVDRLLVVLRETLGQVTAERRAALRALTLELERLTNEAALLGARLERLERLLRRLP